MQLPLNCRGSSSFDTGMPATDIALATAISTGVGTVVMGLVANYPWVVSVQLGTNNYFVNNVLQLGEKCGHYATFKASNLHCRACMCCSTQSEWGALSHSFGCIVSLIQACLLLHITLLNGPLTPFIHRPTSSQVLALGLCGLVLGCLNPVS